MLSREDNELLCRTGPGTPMGNLLRCSWIPALQRGLDPPGLAPESFRVGSVSLVLPRDVASWPEAAREAMAAEPGRFFVSV